MKLPRHASILITVTLVWSLLAPSANPAVAMNVGRGNRSSLGTIRIGQITSLTGPFAQYGAMEVDGFSLGLLYATHGTMKVDGARIVVTTYSDVSGADDLPDPTMAATLATNAIRNDHVQILQCCASSDSAAAVAAVAASHRTVLMAAPAAADSLSGVNRYTFRTSRESSQDAIAGATYADKTFGNIYMTLAPDVQFGHDQVTSWKAQLDRLSANDLGEIYFPPTTLDFTPYIQEILSKKPQWLFVPCTGIECADLWTQLDQQGVLDQVKVVTGLPGLADIPSIGSAGTKMDFVTVYYDRFPKTAANAYLVREMQSRYHRKADIFDQDAFAAAQQIVAALKKTGSTSANKLIKALEGQTVHGPKGAYTVRKQDHVCLQPMYIAQLVSSGPGFTAKLVATLSPKQTAPPIQPHNW